MRNAVHIRPLYPEMDFLSLVLQCSFLPLTVGQDPAIELDTPGLVIMAGSGEPSRSGERVTIDFIIRDENGKEIANSLIRGVPHSFDLLATPGDTLLNGVALKGRPGEERLLIVDPQKWYGDPGPFTLVRTKGTLLVWVRFVRIARR